MGGAWQQVAFVVGLLVDSLADFGTYIFCLETEFIGYYIYGFRIETLIDRYHYAEVHARAYDFVYRYVHHCCKFAHGYKFRKFQSLAFCLLFAHLFVQAFLDGFTLLATIFGAFLVFG